MKQSHSYQFVEDVDRVAAETVGAVDVPAGLADKQQLMQALIRAIPLPDYFGSNWDALDECLRDRLLDVDRQPLCLLHRDLPLNQNERDCRDYLALLEDTLTWAKQREACEFAVVFPTQVARAVKRIGGE